MTFLQKNFSKHRELRTVILFITGLLFTAGTVASVQKMSSHGICGTPYTTALQPSPLGKSPAAPVADPGDSATFYIRKDVTQTSGAAEFSKVECVRVLTTPDIDFYVETTEWQSTRVTAGKIENLRSAMLDETPQGSIDPTQGIYPNEIELFGEPPDVDNNGKIFILLVDVRDNYDPQGDGNYIAGYFDPADQSGYSGNTNDILYIDTNPGLTSSNFMPTLTTAAHEMQHLLHYAADESEATWVNEGMSEVTAHLFNLPARSFSLFLENTANNLTTFNQTIEDYAKVGLWTFYLYSQFGEELLRSIVNTSLDGIDGVNSALTSLGHENFSQVFRNWTVSNAAHNYLPEMPGTTQFRYNDFSVPNVTPALTLSLFPSVENSASIRPYSGSYIQLVGGHDLAAQVFQPGSIPLDATLLLANDSSYSVQDWSVNGSQYRVLQDYNQFENGWLVFTAADGSKNSGTYGLTMDGEGGEVVETLNYSEGDTKFHITLQGGAAATWFEFPDPETRMLEARVNLYNSQPVTLELRTSPLGQLLASRPLESPSQGWNSWRLDTVDVELARCALIVVSETSADSNGVGYGDKDGASENSYFRRPGQSVFHPLSSLSVSGENGERLEGDWNMAMQIAYPVDSTAQHQYSWKHNPWILSLDKYGETVLMTVEFPATGDLSVRVFNLLGQHIKTVKDIRYTSVNRPETAEWDGTNENGIRVSSGIYFFAVDFNGKREVRKLTVIW